MPDKVGRILVAKRHTYLADESENLTKRTPRIDVRGELWYVTPI